MNIVRIEQAVLSRVLFYVVVVVITVGRFLYAIPLTEQQCEAAYLKNPSDNTAKYQWASVAPCSKSIRLYNEVAAAATAHDTLRSAACQSLGDYWFARKNYKTAAEQYKTAIKYVNKPSIRDHWALSLYCDGQYDAALTLWNALALEMKKEFGVVAEFYAGCVALHKGNYTNALGNFEKCGKPDPGKPFTVEALSGRQFCLVMMGKQKDADILTEQLKQFPCTSIDWSLFNGSTVTASNTVQTPLKNIQSDNDKDEFTVQVGAFSSYENASALQGKLAKQFMNVTVATVTLEDRTFYRVRVGSFVTREEAEVFVTDSILNAGFTGKAVPIKMPE